MAGRFPATWLIIYSAGAGEVSGQLASEPVSVEEKGATGVKERIGGLVWGGGEWGEFLLFHVLIS